MLAPHALALALVSGSCLLCPGSTDEASHTCRCWRSSRGGRRRGRCRRDAWPGAPHSQPPVCQRGPHDAGRPRGPPCQPWVNHPPGYQHPLWQWQ